MAAVIPIFDVEYEQPLPAFRTHQALDQLLVHEFGSGEVDGLPLLACAQVQQPDGFTPGLTLGGILRVNFQLPVDFVAGADVGDDFRYIQAAVAGAELAERFRGSKTATGTASQMVFPEQRPPRARVFFEDAGHD